MEHMWGTTWQEDVMIISTLLLALFTMLWALYALLMTVLASMNRYSLNAVATYWINVALAFSVVALFDAAIGLLYFIWSSPVVAFAMNRLDKQWKLKRQANG